MTTTRVWVTLAAVLFCAPAWAGQVTHTRAYDFELFEEFNQLIGHVHFIGDQTVLVPKFDQSTGNTLTKVKLEIDMTISGGLQPLPIPTLVEPCGGEVTYCPEYTTATPNGKAESGPLVAVVDFDDPPYVGELNGQVINLFFEGDGMDMTETELADFINGGSDIPIDIFADLDVQYPVGTIGNGLHLIADGNVSLTYYFRGKDVVIPTPAALGAGLVLLGVVGLRRRR